MVSWCRSFHKHAQGRPMGRPPNPMRTRRPAGSGQSPPHAGCAWELGYNFPSPPNRCMSESGKFKFDSGAVRINPLSGTAWIRKQIAVERPPSIRDGIHPSIAQVEPHVDQRQDCPSDTPRNGGSTPFDVQGIHDEFQEPCALRRHGQHVGIGRNSRVAFAQVAQVDVPPFGPTPVDVTPGQAQRPRSRWENQSGKCG